MKSQKDLGVSLQTLTIPTKSHFIKAFVEKKKKQNKKNPTKIQKLAVVIHKQVKMETHGKPLNV